MARLTLTNLLLSKHIITMAGGLTDRRQASLLHKEEN